MGKTNQKQGITAPISVEQPAFILNLCRGKIMAYQSRPTKFSKLEIRDPDTRLFDCPLQTKADNRVKAAYWEIKTFFKKSNIVPALPDPEFEEFLNHY